MLVAATASSRTSRHLSTRTPKDSGMYQLAIVPIVAGVKVLSSTVVVDAGNDSAFWPDVAYPRMGIRSGVHGVEPMVGRDESGSVVHHSCYAAD
jgi:hypothetical protein